MPQRTRRMQERELYGTVQRWAERHFGCFATSINTGTSYGRVDVVGLRQAPGDLSASTELVCIEVKRGTQPLLNAMGQAFGYSVYGEYCYLADYRPKSAFSEVERGLAERLGVGLIRIRGKSSVELVSTARLQNPIEDFKRQLADQVGFVECSICRTYFPRNINSTQRYGWKNLVRDHRDRSRVERKIMEGRGLVFWPENASENDRTHDARHKTGQIYNRRFACNTCARLFYGVQSSTSS